VLFGGMDRGEFQVGEQVVIGIDQREVDLTTLLHGRRGKALGHALPVGFVGECFAELGEVILAVGLLDMSSQLCALAPQVHPSAEPVAGGTHRGRVGIGLWEHAAPE
jgi:hypothetical protein